MLTPELIDKFSSIANQLNPENLSCDGEMPMHLVRKRAKKLHAEWAALEKQAGRTVTEEDVYSYEEKVKAYDALHIRVSRDNI